MSTYNPLNAPFCSKGTALFIVLLPLGETSGRSLARPAVGRNSDLLHIAIIRYFRTWRYALRSSVHNFAPNK